MKKLIALTLGLSMLTATATPAFAYEVKSGDTMSKIAQEHKVSLYELAKANPQIKNIDLIYVGQTINTQVTKEVQSEQIQSTSKTIEQPKSNESSYTMKVEATAYTAYCDGCSGITATGINLRSNPNQKVIAVDPNVIPLGSKVYVEGYGMAIAGDTGGAIKGKRIDLFIPNHSQMIDFGRRQVEITVYK